MNVKLNKILLAAALVSCAVPAYAEFVNITNPSFENRFDGWRDTDPSSISGLSFDGNDSAKITGSAGRVEQDVAVTPNTNYVLSAYVRGSGTIGVYVGSDRTSKSSSSSSWKKVSVEFNSGSQSSVEIYAKHRSGDVRYDLFTLESLSSGGDTPPPPPAEEPTVNCSTNANLPIDTATDNGTNDGNGPANTLDNNFSSRWSSFGSGKTIRFDLGEQADIKEVSLAWFKGNQRRAFFEIDTSADGNNWTSVLASAQSSGNTTQLETFDVTDSIGRYVRVVGQGNSSSQWNSILEARVSGCVNGSTTPPDPTPDPDPTPTPPSGSSDIELIDWNISVPVDRDNNGKADTIKEPQLAGGEELRPYFFKQNDGSLVFRANVKGAKTSSNTKFTRSELREMLRRGDTKYKTKGVGGNNWVFGSAPSSDRNNAGGVDGTLTASLAVNHVTTTGDRGQVGRVIVGQIHANDDEPLRLYYRKLPGNSKGSIYFAHEPNGGSDQYVEMIGKRSSSASNPSDGIALNEKFAYRVNVSGNTLTVTITRDGKPDVSRSVNMSNSGYSNGGQYMYFKAGVYNQNNSGNDDDYAQATFYSIVNKHTGYAF